MELEAYRSIVEQVVEEAFVVVVELELVESSMEVVNDLIHVSTATLHSCEFSLSLDCTFRLQESQHFLCQHQ